MSGDLKSDLAELLSRIGNFPRDEMQSAARSISARLSRATVTEPEPTEAELRAGLLKLLPEGWGVNIGEMDGECSVRTGERHNSTIAYPPYAALRKDLKRTAEALRWLAGEVE